MLTVYSDKHRLHHGSAELIHGEMTACFEMPSRADFVLERIKSTQLGEVIAPEEFDMDALSRIHSKQYLDFLQSAWSQWVAVGRTSNAIPMVWPTRNMRNDEVPDDIDGRLGYFSSDAGVPITAGTWEAVKSSADVAITAAKHIKNGAESAFALCRPPGHHASKDVMGGYCYVNNIAVAAQYLLDNGAKRVAILDVDYHHGNGTQSIFYARNDVLVLSIHADPKVEYPYFLGYADEKGEGLGFGYTHNYPLPHGTTWETYQTALQHASRQISIYQPEVVLVSLGVDTFERDPISKFKLRSEDYLKMGEAIAELNYPTLFVFEGGYAVDEVGVNTVNVLSGFSAALLAKAG